MRDIWQFCTCQLLITYLRSNSDTSLETSLDYTYSKNNRNNSSTCDVESGNDDSYFGEFDNFESIRKSNDVRARNSDIEMKTTNEKESHNLWSSKKRKKKKGRAAERGRESVHFNYEYFFHDDHQVTRRHYFGTTASGRLMTTQSNASANSADSQNKNSNDWNHYTAVSESGKELNPMLGSKRIASKIRT